MPPVVVARDLVKQFGSFTAVDHISFDVQQGEVLGFLGPNGAGKTTTMKMIECVSPRTNGTLEVFGMDPATRSREIKRLLGVVPQETNLDPDFTAFQNLTVYARYFDIPREEAEAIAEKLLDFVQLQEKRDVPIEKLSGGMKRRLILARALVNRPQLLILDEPTIGLDPQARHVIWERLRTLQDEGNTILLTTHYMEEAARLCDRIVIMDRGTILKEGPPAALVQEMVGSSIVEAKNDPRAIACLDRIHARYEVIGDLIQVYTDTPKEVASAIMDGCGVHQITARPATLEDVFLKIAGRTLRE
ncbi:MAG: ABC transporter ATP-binding protein [Methanobacteriota archaeon]|nr:MAG: ABC transporter ATP-binding protein [Euryarchaeota archaeon]